jgi:hypothetical protein
VRQDFHVDDGYMYICHHKSPSEVAAQSHVQAPCIPSIGVDGRSIFRVQGVIYAVPAPQEELVWEDAQVEPSVDERPQLGCAVCDEEKAGAGCSNVSRY